MAANWRKVVVSGSAAELSNLSVDNRVNITGSLNASSSVVFQGLTNASQAYIVSYDAASGQLYYQGTGSFIADSASYASTASYAFEAISASSAASSSFAVSSSYASSSLSASYALSSTSASHAITADTASSVGVLNQPVIISGSLAINTTTGNSFDINADTFTFTGSLSTTGSVAFAGLQQASASYTVGFDPTTGNLTYQDSSDQAISSSYALTASYLESGASASFATSASNAESASFALSGDGIFSGSFSGSFAGDGSNLTGVSASILLNAISQSTGITAFNFDGSAAAVVEVSGSSTLSSGSVVMWTGDAFKNSSISEDTGVVLINNAGGVLIQQGGLYVTGASTFHDNVVMQGNLIVQGTASFQNTQNLEIADQFILLNSGSATFQDSGIVIATGNSANSGSAFFLETAGTTTGTNALNGRFAIAGGVDAGSGSVTAESYMNTTVIDPTSNPLDVTPPAFGGSGLGQGNMWVNASTSEIWIYA